MNACLLLLLFRADCAATEAAPEMLICSLVAGRLVPVEHDGTPPTQRQCESADPSLQMNVSLLKQ